MKGKAAVRVALDVAMATVLVAVMSTALVQEAPHEWLGVSMFSLMTIHIVFNRAWLASVFRARRSALRIVQIVVMVGLAVCVIGQLASSLVLSKHAFGLLPAIPGAIWARRVHMLCAYWTFVLAFAHAGLHVRIPKHMAHWQLWAARAAIVALGCYGVYSLVQLGMLPYLFGLVQFAAADYEAPLALAFVRYAGVGVLVACLFHYLRALLMVAARRY